MSQWIVKLGGQVTVEADSHDEAQDKAIKLASLYCWPSTPLMIGRDVDELGYPLTKSEGHKAFDRLS